MNNVKCVKCRKFLRVVDPTKPYQYLEGWDGTILHKKCWTEMMREERRAKLPDEELGMPCVRCKKLMNVCREAWGRWSMHKKCWKATVLEAAIV